MQEFGFKSTSIEENWLSDIEIGANTSILASTWVLLGWNRSELKYLSLAPQLANNHKFNIYPPDYMAASRFPISPQTAK